MASSSSNSSITAMASQPPVRSLRMAQPSLVRSCSEVFQHPTDSQWTLISPSMSILCDALLAVKSRMCFAVMQICGTYVGPTVLGTLCAVSVRVVDFVD